MDILTLAKEAAIKLCEGILIVGGGFALKVLWDCAKEQIEKKYASPKPSFLEGSVPFMKSVHKGTSWRKNHG